MIARIDRATSPFGLNPPAKSQPIGQDQLRFLGFDALRLVAVLAVVWFHAKAPGWPSTTWHVPALVILSVALACLTTSERSFPDSVRRRASRVLIPWLFWCLVYAIVDAVRYAAVGRSTVADFGIWLIVTGTTIHLWFLPFIFATTVIASFLQGWQAKLGVISTSTLVSIAVVLAISLIATLDATAADWVQLPIPFPQWLAAFPAVLIGYGLGTAFRYRTQSRALSYLMIGAASTMLLIEHYVLNLRISLAWQYSMAFFLVSIASLWRTPNAPKWLTAVFSTALGLYLVHPLMDSIVRFQLPQSQQASSLHGILTILLSIALVCTLQKTGLKRFI